MEEVLLRYNPVIVAYLYGSYLRQDVYQDIDIAVLLAGPVDPVSSLKMQLGISR